MSESSEQPLQLLEGYTLLDRLGSGGYGEVWRARAPGGLFKALKYVYGRQEESRAASELKALERIKGVRHPFMLSLERIEIVDGRLIVVTELADGSIRDRYEDCVREGLPGVPREELIGYLRDTADALDFLSAEHDLQHLDIKPENLLLLAGHVKVADFGLVKSINNQAESLVGGMTPTYAAPEVFQGRPSKHSDQYSLAILYQEMLTGGLPFPGANVAELTLQHLNDEPNLNSLPDEDRFVISRALAKDAQYRFDTCGDLVRALAEVDASATCVNSPQAPRFKGSTWKADKKESDKSSSNATMVFEGEEDPGWSASKAPILMDLPPVAEPGARHVAAPEFDEQTFSPSPALFLGIGGTGGQVLRALRQRLSERFPEAEGLPALPMLLLDTDAKSLVNATRGANKGAGLTKEETIALSLRRPQAYRDKSGDLLRWLGRRWLYNIPRSLQTEGIRPLGRLALVDHARRTFQRIRKAISDCVELNSVAQTSSETGLEFNADRLRVYVCGSISGGTGGGMSLDVAYAVRAIMARLDVSGAEVIGVMTHSTSRDLRRSELAQVNAYSWLSEYYHFGQTDAAYPGDEGCGLPAHQEGQAAFDSAYLVDLGSGLDTVGFDNAAQSVADYLYLDALTPAGPFIDACRQADGVAQLAVDQGDPLPLRPQLRTFSIVRGSASPTEQLKQVALQSVDRLVCSWMSDGDCDSDGASTESQLAKTTTNPLVHGVVQLVGKLKLNAPSTTSLCRSLLEAHLGEDAESIVTRLSQQGATARKWNQVVAPVEAIFAAPEGEETSDDTPAWMAGNRIDQLVAPLAEKIQEDLRGWFAARVETPGEHLEGARRATAWFRDHLAAFDRELESHTATAQRHTQEWIDQSSSIGWAKVGSDIVEAARVKRLRQYLDSAALRAANGVMTSIVCVLDEVDEKIASMTSALDRLLDRPSEPSNDSESPDLSDEEIVKLSNTAFEKLQEQVEHELLPRSGGLAGVTRSEAALTQFNELLCRLADQVVTRAWESKGNGGDEVDSCSFACPLPSLAECGSAVRQLSLAPEVCDKAGGQGDLPANVTKIIAPDEASYCAVEAGELSLPHVAAEVIGRRRDYATLAERVHTRRDVQWTDLTKSLDMPVESGVKPTIQPTMQANPVPEPVVVECTQQMEVAPGVPT